MSELLVLDGPPALSAFRLDKLGQQLGVAGRDLYAQYVHLLALDVPLAAEDRSRAQSLLRYGPERGLPEPQARG